MKYWNKSKHSREFWTKVQRPVIWAESKAPAVSWLSKAKVAFPEMQREEEMKLWCQRQPSRGKFYFKEGDPTWYFENAVDATWFAMHWAK